MDRYIVISSDCHAGLPGERYRDYLDPQYRETFDHAYPLQVQKIKAAEKAFLIQEINDQWREGIEQQLTGAWDHAERIRMLDGDGIAGEIIFPDGITEMNTPPFGAGLSLPTVWARVGTRTPPSSSVTAAPPTIGRASRTSTRRPERAM